MKEEKLSFACDYARGAHPNIINRMVETNMISTAGYGLDDISGSARDRIRKACGCPEAFVEFLIGGTQTNAIVMDAFLRPWEAVIAADTGHISVHEAGAVEANGHKVLTIPHHFGKITADDVGKYMTDFYNDPNHNHMVFPSMIYLSQPTEYGTLYKAEELEDFREVCDAFNLTLYVDGARLAYALASPANDISLKTLADFCDAFYIGGTKCGALFGEALVIPDPKAVPQLFTLIKQHGALLAKGRMLGIQFDELFRDDLYMKIGKSAVIQADRLRKALSEKGYQLSPDCPTNQVFCVMEDEKLQELSRKVEYSFWEKTDENHTMVRFAADWMTTGAETDQLTELL